MAALIRSTVLAALLGAILAATPAHADPVARWRPYIAEASQRFGIPAAWIERVMRAESGGRTRQGGRPITSRAGAMGLMQLMPGTWAQLRRAHGFGSDPHDPRDNILAGAAYLRAMYDRFGYPGLFAAYNAGPARYAAHLKHGRPLPAETRAYLQTVTERRIARADTPVEAPADTLFAVRRTLSERSRQSQPPELSAPFARGNDASPSTASGGTLFVPLKGR